MDIKHLTIWIRSKLFDLMMIKSSIMFESYFYLIFEKRLYFRLPFLSFYFVKERVVSKQGDLMTNYYKT